MPELNPQQLLAAAEEYCETETGEVLRKIPESLMGRLRAANLVWQGQPATACLCQFLQTLLPLLSPRIVLESYGQS